MKKEKALPDQYISTVVNTKNRFIFKTVFKAPQNVKNGGTEPPKWQLRGAKGPAAEGVAFKINKSTCPFYSRADTQIGTETQLSCTVRASGHER